MWEQGLDVVVVGFGAAKLRGDRPEGFRLDRGLYLFCGEAGGADEEFPAVVLDARRRVIET